MIKKGLNLIFKRRDFGLLMGSQFLAQAGDGLVQGALAGVIAFGAQKGFDIEAARTPEEILRIALYIFVPYTFLSPLLGVVIDRWDRRRVLLVANGLRGVLVLGIGLSGIKGIGDGLLFFVFLLTLSSTRVVLATKAAALPETVERPDLMAANGISQLGGALFQLGGAGVALVAKSILPAEPIVIMGALVYLGGAALALLIKRAGKARERGSFGEELAGVVRSITAGWAQVSRTQKAAAAIATYFWLRLLWSYSLTGLAFVARELVANDDLQLAVLTAGAGGIGAALGFVSSARLLERVRSTGHLVLASSSLAGIAVTVLGALQARVTLALLAFCLGFGFFLGKISLDTMVQEALGDDFRGRAFSLYDIAYNLAWVLAAGLLYVLWPDDASGTVAKVLIAGAGVVFLAGIAGIGAWFKSAGLLRPSRSEQLA